MNKGELQQFLLEASRIAKERDATPRDLLLSIYRYAFGDKRDRLVELTRLGRATTYRANTFDIGDSHEEQQPPCVVTSAPQPPPPQPSPPQTESLAEVLARVNRETKQALHLIPENICEVRPSAPPPPVDSVQQEEGDCDERHWEEFKRIYPKRDGFKSSYEIIHVKAAWNNCIKRDGYTGEEIVRALKEAITSKRWTDNSCSYVPKAIDFLEKEKMTDFLPAGFLPKSRRKSVSDEPESTSSYTVGYDSETGLAF